MNPTDESETTGHEACCGEVTGKPGEPSHCPMAKKFHDTLGSPMFSYGLLLPGTLLILIGVLILANPKVLVWLAAGGAILFGLLFLAGALMLRKWADSMKR